MNNPVLISDVAKDYYLFQGLNCAESVSKAILEGAGCQPQVVGTVTACSRGFGAGVGGAGCICGALAGGVMALSVLGKDDKLLIREQAKRLHDGFCEKHRVTCCRALGRELKQGSPERKLYCAGLVQDVAILAEEIIKGQ